MDGVPAAEMGRRVGHRKLSVTLYTYSHVVLDRREIDYASLLAELRTRSRSSLLVERRP